MSTAYIPANTAEVIEFCAVNSSGAAATGITTLRVRVRRVSDGYFFDWSDNTFKAAASVTTIGGTMTEVSATYDPGRYALSWPGSSAGAYAVSIYLSSGSAAANIPAGGEIRVGELASASAVAVLPTASANATALLDAALSGHSTSGTAGQALGRLDAAVSSRAAPGDAMDLVTDALDSAAVATSAVTELQNGLATASSLSSVASGVSDVQGRLPAALVGGRIDASVGAVASAAITSAAFATDSITSTALAASAVSEIQSGLATSSALSTAQADLDDIQTRLPTALIGGRIDATVGAMQADVLTSSALATSAVTEIQSGLATSSAVAALPSASSNAAALLDASLSGHSTAGTAGEALGRIDATVSSRSSHSAADVWAVGTRVLTGIGSSGIASQISVDALPTAAANAGAVWASGARTLTGIGSSGIASQTSVDALPSAATIASSVASALATAHGAGSWATATGFAEPGDQMALTAGAISALQSGLATSTALADAQTAIDAIPTAAEIDAQLSGAHGSGTWTTAVGFATSSALASLQGDVDDLSTAVAALPSASAIGAAVWATAEGSPSPGTHGYGSKLARQMITNRNEVDAAGGGRERLFADDGTTAILTWTLRDASGDPITLLAGSPARRGAAT